jgi:hypothetical protein
VPRFGPGDVSIAAPSAPVLADRTACPGSPAMSDLHRPDWVGTTRQVAPSADPAPADLPHRGPRARVAAHTGSGRALPHFPRSRARPGSDHVAAVVAWDAHPRAPLMMRLELSSSLLLPRGATPFEGFSSPAAVPRHRGLCPLACRLRHPVDRVATVDGVRSLQATRPCSTVELVVALDVAIVSGPILPWACVPSRLFGGFASAKRRSGAHLMPCPVGEGDCAEAQHVHPHRHDGSGLSRRSGSDPTCAGQSPGAEAPNSCQSRHRPETDLRSLTSTSSGANRRSGYGALDDLPPLPTGS